LIFYQSGLEIDDDVSRIFSEDSSEGFYAYVAKEIQVSVFEVLKILLIDG
jgi:hypothetical protein